MATRLIQFPARNAFVPVRSHDSLARDTRYQASRIAEQVEQEMARKAQRMSVGLRIEFAEARRTCASNILIMPRKSRVQRNQQTRLDKIRCAFRAAAFTMLRWHPAR